MVAAGIQNQLNNMIAAVRRTSMAGFQLCCVHQLYARSC